MERWISGGKRGGGKAFQWPGNADGFGLKPKTPLNMGKSSDIKQGRQGLAGQKKKTIWQDTKKQESQAESGCG